MISFKKVTLYGDIQNSKMKVVGIEEKNRDSDDFEFSTSHCVR